jgi:hypothetical protein
LIRESLEFIYEKVPDVLNGDYFRLSFLIGHESIVRIIGKLNLSVYAKLKLTEDKGTGVFTFLGTVGTSLSLMF